MKVRHAPWSVESTADSLVDILDGPFVRVYTKTGISGTEGLVYASPGLSTMTASRAIGVIVVGICALRGHGDQHVSSIHIT